MKKKAWKTRIKKACRDAGTYKPYFDHVITELAGILERRDELEAIYEEDPQPLNEYAYKEGMTNKVKNPLLVMIDDLNKQALAYWKELGLTPAGLKRINDMALKEAEATKSNSLLDKLAELKGTAAK